VANGLEALKKKKSRAFAKLKATLPSRNRRQPKEEQIDLPTLRENPLRKAWRRVSHLPRLAWQWFWRFLAALSVVAGILFFLPRLDVSPGPGSANDEPWDAPISLTNNGFLSVYPQSITCWVGSYLLMDPKNPTRHAGVENLAFAYTGSTGEIQRGETADFLPAPPFEFHDLPPAYSAEFMFIVDYKQHWWPWLLHKRVRYSVTRDAIGNWRWIRPYMSNATRTMNPKTKIILPPAVQQKIRKKPTQPVGPPY